MDSINQKVTSVKKENSNMANIAPMQLSSPTAYTAKNNKNSRYMKIFVALLGVSIIVFAVIITNQNSNKKIIVDKSTKVQSTSSSISTVSIPNTSAAERFNTAFKTSIATYIFEGKIIEISEIGGIDPTFKKRFDVMFKIKGVGDKPSSLYFTNEMLKKFKIYERVNGKEVIIDFKKLNVGDNINVSYSWEMEEKTNQYTKLLDGEIRRF